MTWKLIAIVQGNDAGSSIREEGDDDEPTVLSARQRGDLLAGEGLHDSRYGFAMADDQCGFVRLYCVTYVFDQVVKPILGYDHRCYSTPLSGRCSRLLRAQKLSRVNVPDIRAGEHTAKRFSLHLAPGRQRWIRLRPKAVGMARDKDGGLSPGREWEKKIRRKTLASGRIRDKD